MGLPVLGICYGMQTMAGQLGGSVATSDVREFGYAQVKVEAESSLLQDIKDHVGHSGESLLDVWMSHGDKVVAMPEGFSLITVDLDGLKIGDSIHISAITLPDGVEPTITDRDFTVATLQSPGGGVKNEDEDEAEGGADAEYSKKILR